MKNKSASQSAFFNLRLLIGLFIVLAGVFLALAGFGVVQAQQKNNIITNSTDPLVPNGFDCSRIHELGIDKQENFRAGAIMIACGIKGRGHSASPIGGAFSHAIRAIKKLWSPLVYGATDVELITPQPETTFPNITQSETFTTVNPDNSNQIVVAYNDSRCRNCSPINISGASVSNDGGATFTRLTPSPFANTVGDPVVIYNSPTGNWFTVWLDLACGGQGLGGYKATDPLNGPWTHFCVFNEGSADRESGWADNNSASPFFGHMYVSWNDFNVGGGALFVTVSTDNGATWTPHQITSGSPFIRDVQITGDDVTGEVWIAGMDEGGGSFPHNDTNLFFRSIDGGSTWSGNTCTNCTPFPGPGVTAVGYFAQIFSANGGYWRHEGWGQPAAHNGILHYAYDQHGTGSDPADVYYIRSSDHGVTFSAPLKLNTDATTRPNWQPNLSASQAGTVFATWYDARETPGPDCSYGNPASPCYRMWARKSNDNGVSWLPDDMFSDVVSPLPAQPDPGIQPTYAGDYDYGSAILTKHVTSWDDGRVAISGQSQQDTFFDREAIGFAVASTVPACGSFVVGTAPVQFVVNLSDAVNPSTVQATDFTVNGTPANSFTLNTPQNTQITFNFNSSPVVQGQNTMHIPAAAFNRASDNQPNFEFLCTFRYGIAQLQVTTTNPPVGGTFTGPGTVMYDVNWNIPVDPTSVQVSDLTLSGVPATVTAVSVINANMTTEFTINFSGIFSGTLTASIAAGAITDTHGNPSAAFSGNYNYVGSVCDSGLIQNGGFESGVFGPWVLDGHTNDPVVTNTQAHSGTFSAFAGGNPQLGHFCGLMPPEPLGDSSFYQQFTVPAGGGTLSFWHWDCTADSITFDWQDAYITDSNGTILTTIFHQCSNTMAWVNQTVDMAPYAGTTVRIKFLVHQDGFSAGDLTGMYVDDVALFEGCGPTASDAFSRKVHGGAGTFDIPLPLSGNVGVECRSGGGIYQMIIDFPTTVTVGSASVTSGAGMVSSFSGSGTSQITVNLTGVTDAQRITMTLHNVNNGTTTGDVPVSMGVLIGDVNGNATVNSSDVALTKSKVGQAVDGTNFREDVNVNGTISSSDVALVKSDVGHALPP